MSMFRLWQMLNRRGSASKTHTAVLAVIAFASATAIFLTVLGGVHAFIWRASAGHTISCAFDGVCGPGISGVAEGPDSLYVVLALFACLLLLVPFATLAASAARLCAARRDARLSALRLVGATNAQVVRLTALDTAFQALCGALFGVAGYFILMPAVMLLKFQGRHFAFHELWVGLPALLLTAAGVTMMALLASVSALHRVVITPLGVSARVGTGQPGVWRFGVVAAAFITAIVVFKTPLIRYFGTAVAVAVVIGFIVICYALLNLLGPWVISVRAKARARHPGSPATLIAMRRILDNPKRAWRNVSGIALAVFVAGITSVCSYLAASGYDDGAAAGDDGPVQRAAVTLLQDIGTGGLLTLVFAAVLAAVSCGIMQAGNVYDQEDEYRMLALEGVDASVMDRARLTEVMTPLNVVVLVAGSCSLLLMLPLVGSLLTRPQTLVGLVVGIVLCYLLVSVGALASNRVAAGLDLLDYRADD